MNSALIVVDMINDFVHEKGSLTVGEPARKIVPYIADKIEDCRVNGDLVVAGIDWHTELECLRSGWPIHAATPWGREDFGVLAKMIPHHVYKSGYDSFKGTGLFTYLSIHDVETVHICGVCTDICVFATAMGAFDAGLKTIIHSRGCATFTPHHDLFLEHMKLCFQSEIVQ